MFDPLAISCECSKFKFHLKVLIRFSFQLTCVFPQKQKFTTVLDRLQSSLRENLASYKAVYPSNRGQEKLDDLENSIALLTSIVFFRLKVRNHIYPSYPVKAGCNKSSKFGPGKECEFL